MDNNKNRIGTNSVQYIVVNIGDEQYGIDIKYVDNIVRMQKITRVPKAQFFYKGVINLRGEIIPVMSVRSRFGLSDDEYSGATRIIVLKPEQQEAIGIIVDAVKEVVTLEEGDIEKMYSDGKDERSKFVTAVGKNGDNLISLLNVNGVLDFN
ncbi:MAG: chemotaxis protein CheW [Clostridiales bacterium]|nr:chemotaxis protein CheW [Clostridiales bacterium]